MASKILRNRDKKILDNILDGKTIKELAKCHNCSERTISNRRKEIFEKTKCLSDYTLKDGNIDKYYKTNYGKRLKITSEEQFSVVSEDTSLYKVYILTFPNEKVYIGITSQDEKKRWDNGEGYIKNQNMYNDILKYGWINIKKNILYKNLTHDEAREKEKELIINYKSHIKKYGYNRSF